MNKREQATFDKERRKWGLVGLGLGIPGVLIVLNVVLKDGVLRQFALFPEMIFLGYLTIEFLGLCCMALAIRTWMFAILTEVLSPLGAFFGLVLLMTPIWTWWQIVAIILMFLVWTLVNIVDERHKEGVDAYDNQKRIDKMWKQRSYRAKKKNA